MTATTADRCYEAAAECVCELPVGHDGPHHCTRHQCGGRWLGRWGGVDFEAVEFPIVGGADPGRAMVAWFMGVTSPDFGAPLDDDEDAP